MNSIRMVYKLLNERLLVTAKMFKVVQEDVLLPSGVESERTIVRHPGAIVVVPLLHDGRFVMVRQYRHAIRDYIYEFPAGTLEPGEDIAVCAQRELIEEVGYRAAELRPFGKLVPAPGFCDEVQHCYFATALTEEKGEMDEDEVIEVQYFSEVEILEAIRNEQFIDGKTLAVFMKAKAMGFF